jgi:ParB family chromosome partitioning protein
MADWWRPTYAGFFDRITKDQIVAAVSEGVSKETARGLTDRKKSQMGREAEALLAGKRWLPEPLRVSTPAQPVLRVSIPRTPQRNSS